MYIHRKLISHSHKQTFSKPLKITLVPEPIGMANSPTNGLEVELFSAEGHKLYLSIADFTTLIAIIRSLDQKLLDRVLPCS